MELLGFAPIKHKGMECSSFTRSGYQLPAATTPQTTPGTAVDFTVHPNKWETDRKLSNVVRLPWQATPLLVTVAVLLLFVCFCLFFEARTKIAQAGLNSTPDPPASTSQMLRLGLQSRAPTSVLFSHSWSKESIIISLFRLESAG